MKGKGDTMITKNKSKQFVLFIGAVSLLSACAATPSATSSQEQNAADAVSGGSPAASVSYDPAYQYVDLDTGIRMAYVDLGDASNPTVVFLHGATDTYLSWSQIAPRVANSGYRVIVPELRGHGKTDKPEEGPYTLQTHAKDITHC